jgi:nitroimidazol reductase NimA-like FMN-containing flavoprotein (pyridoxamine 5'-phosphate oxidase superfamily)
MPIKRGSVALFDGPVATELLQSDIPARLAYIGIDGLPRVVPVWSEWNGRRVVIVSPSTSAKLKSLARNPNVALTIDSAAFPWHVLLVRGTAGKTVAVSVAEHRLDVRVIDCSGSWERLRFAVVQR